MRLRFTRSDGGGGWAQKQVYDSLHFIIAMVRKSLRVFSSIALRQGSLLPIAIGGKLKVEAKSEIVSRRARSPHRPSRLLSPWIILFLRQCQCGTSKVMELQIVRQLLACKSQLANTLGCKWLSPKSNCSLASLALARGWILFAFPMESYALAKRALDGRKVSRAATIWCGRWDERWRRIARRTNIHLLLDLTWLSNLGGRKIRHWE